MKFSTYIFDQGNVILNIEPQLSLDAFTPLLNGKGAITAADLLGGAVGSLVGQYQIGAISTDAFIDSLMPSMKPNVTRTQVLTAWNALIQDVPQVRREALLKLRASGSRVYMLSNTNDAHMARIYEKCFAGKRDNMLNYFDDLFLSNEMHLSKPSIEIFQEVIKRTRINPSESLFIDDIQKNLDTAAELGFNTMLSTGGDWVERFQLYWRGITPTIQ